MKGRILKIKTGYNPNSSSIGVDVVVFFTAGAALTLLFNTAVAVIAAAKAQKDGRLAESAGRVEGPPEPGRREEQG